MLLAYAVTPPYISMMRVPLLAGRTLSETDGAKSSPVLLISAETARRFWPNESAIGKHIKLTGSKEWSTIVGVVGDVKHYSLSRGLPNWVSGAMYMPYPQARREDGEIPAAMTLLVKSNLDSSLLGGGSRNWCASRIRTCRSAQCNASRHCVRFDDGAPVDDGDIQCFFHCGDAAGSGGHLWSGCLLGEPANI